MSFLHIRYGQARFGNPLERSSGGHNIELRPEIEVRCIAIFKMQVRKRAVFSARELREPRITIDANPVPMGSNVSCDTGRDRARSTTNVQHSNIRPQQCRKTAVVPLKSAAPENAGIRLMGLGRHVSFAPILRPVPLESTRNPKRLFPVGVRRGQACARHLVGRSSVRVNLAAPLTESSKS